MAMRGNSVQSSSATSTTGAKSSAWDLKPMRDRVAKLLNLAGSRPSMANAFEPLEPRQLLSATTLPEGISEVQWGGQTLPAVTGQYLITFDDYLGEDGADLKAREVAAELGVNATDFRAIGRGGWAAFKTNDQITIEQVRNLVTRIDGLKWVEPDLAKQTQRVSNDPLFTNQWQLNNAGQTIQGQIGVAGADVSILEAWDTTIGSSNVVVGVIDTGVQLDHPDLINNIYRNPGEIPGNGIDDDGNGYTDDISGFDFGDGDANATDEQGHGTAVAGVIGAVGNNGIGVAGVAWNVKILPLKIATSNGNLSNTAIVAAHDYSTMMRQRGVNLVATNNSYGAFLPAFYEDTPDGFAGERLAIERFIDSGGTFVVAAGNDGNDNDGQFSAYPASYNVPGVISVAATDNQDGLAGFSNFGPRTVDLAAPGQDIYTTQLGSGYGFISGTSFSSPMVAGAVALLKTIKPNASAVELREALLNSADPLASLQGRVRTGARMNVAEALRVIQIAGPTVTSVDPGPVTTAIDGQGNVVNTVKINFSKDINASLINLGGITLRGSVNNVFGDSDDFTVPLSSFTATSARSVTVNLNLAGFAGSRLPVANYRLTLDDARFRDTTGNFLNGNNSSGTDELYEFRVASGAGENEPNDTLGTATPISFAGGATVNLSGLNIGNGIFTNFDVDFYRLDLPRGGSISAETFAQRLATPSTLDTVIRLFDANGVQIASNDQFSGNDSFVNFFVATGGAYYVGVSGFGNSNYNPVLAGSGSAQSTGQYSLKVTYASAADDTIGYTFRNVAFGTNVTQSNGGFASASAYDVQTNLPVDSAQTQGTTTSFIDISDTRQILDLDVRLRLTHTSLDNITVSLISPGGVEVKLIDRRGGTGDNLTNTIFDDEATQAITAGFAPFTGNFRPEQALGAFDGTTGIGRWTLKIVDALPNDRGRLLNWAMDIRYQNNIFGPLESNDNTSTATPLNEIVNGIGTSTRTAFIGDGGFGSQDRDFFQFNAAAGSTISAVVTSGGSLNSVLRLFDSAGTQITLSNLTTSLDSRIENYTFAAGGTYYLAVHEYAQYFNTDGTEQAFNTTNVGTPSIAATTGNYTLNVTLAAGVSDPDLALTGDFVSVGVNTGGTYSGAGVGIRYNNLEFLNPGNTNAQQFIGLQANGSSFVNSGPTGSNALPFALNSLSDSLNNRLTATGTFNGIKIERAFSFAQGDKFIAVDVNLTNTTTSDVANVGFMEGFNPQQGIALNEGSLATNNDLLNPVVNGSTTKFKLARASFVNNQFLTGGGLTVALAAPAADARAAVRFLGNGVTVRDTSVLTTFPATDPAGSTNDQMVIDFDIGTLAAGGQTSFRYFILFGDTQADVNGLYSQINNGTGAGHLAATSTSSATETLSDGSTNVAQLPYRVYYPEGFLGPNIFNFLPISNPNDKPVNIVVIQRFEGVPDAQRDRVAGSFTIPANSRKGLDINTPDMYRSTLQFLPQIASTATQFYGPANAAPTSNGDLTQLPVGRAFSLELRSDLPVAATFSYYDLEQFTQRDANTGRPVLNTAPRPVAVGESFTPNTSTQWAFADVEKRGANAGVANSINSYVTLYNASGTAANVTVRAFHSETGAVYRQQLVINPFTRAGAGLVGGEFWVLEGSVGDQLVQIPDGTFGVTVTSTQELVAAKTTYSREDREAAGTVGETGLGSTRGIIPEGQFGLRSTSETLGILNPNNTATTVTFEFLFNNGSADRRSITVPANSHRVIDIANFSGFTTGRPYGVYYESTQPVILNATSPVKGQPNLSDAFSQASTNNAYTFWGFGEGYRPADGRTFGDGTPAPLYENLRLYNPNNQDVTIEIKIVYDREGTSDTETFRRVLPARRLSEFNIDDFITGSRRQSNQAFGLFVKAPLPIVAGMNHYDSVFPGAFSTLGTPLGRIQTVS